MNGMTPKQILSIAIPVAIIIVVWIALDILIRHIIKGCPTEQRKRFFTILRRVVKWVALVAMVVSVFSISSKFRTFFNTFIAGSGVVAIILSIASQQAIGNFISGVIIIFSKPYKVGDLIRYTDTGTLGWVTEIKMRHTIIKTLENTQLIVPNSTINSAAIENYSFNDDRRVCQKLTVDITYESDYNKALVLLTAVIVKNKDYIDVRTEQDKEDGKPPVTVRLRRFADSSMELEAWVWAINYTTWLNMRSDLHREIKHVFDTNGIDFAYPHVQVVN